MITDTVIADKPCDVSAGGWLGGAGRQSERFRVRFTRRLQVIFSSFYTSFKGRPPWQCLVITDMVITDAVIADAVNADAVNT